MNQIHDLINNHVLNMQVQLNNPMRFNAAQRLPTFDAAQVMVQKWKKTYEQADLENSPN